MKKYTFKYEQSIYANHLLEAQNQIRDKIENTQPIDLFNKGKTKHNTKQTKGECSECLHSCQSYTQ